MKPETAALSPEELHALIGSDDQSLRAYLASATHAADIKDFFEHADDKDWPRFLRLIDDQEKRAEVFSELDESHWESLLSQLSADEIADLVDQMESDDAADLLGHLPIEARYNALRRVPFDHRRQIQQLLHYPEDSAGGIMQVELAQVRQDAMVSDAISKVRELVEDDVEVFAVWVVDAQERLVGSVALVDLLLNKATTPINQLVDTEIVAVKPLVDQEEVASLFRKYDLITLPVVDDENHLLGRIVVDDVVDVLEEEADEDALHMGGTSVEELDYPEEVLKTAKIRLPWLAVSLLCSLISMFLLLSFESIIAKAIAIFTFVPVISNMAGGVGTQTSTIMVRSFATKKAGISDLPRILFKELRVGMIMGLVYGLAGGLVVALILGKHYAYVGPVVFVAMTLALTTAAIVGVLAPSILKSLNIDPAIASGPFVTTLNDIAGILIYMVTAATFLHLFPPS